LSRTIHAEHRGRNQIAAGIRRDRERLRRLPQFSGETRPCRSAYMLAPIRFDAPIFV
jgi:hypothetical protein